MYALTFSSVYAVPDGLFRGSLRCGPLPRQFLSEAAIRSRPVPKQGSKARSLVLRVAESLLDKTLVHGSKIVGQPTRTPFFPQSRFKAVEICVARISDLFPQQLRPHGCRIRTTQHL